MTVADGGSLLKGKAADVEEGDVVSTPVNTGGGDVNSGKKRNILTTLWEFSRPHTMIGTAIAIPAVGIFAAPPGGEYVSCHAILIEFELKVYWCFERCNPRLRSTEVWSQGEK